MNISINKALFSVNEQLKIGLIHYSKIIVEESPQMIKGRTQLYQENLYLELQETPVTERTGIKEWRQLWKAFGGDPNRYRHSAESLMRRIAKQQYFHSRILIGNAIPGACVSCFSRLSITASILRQGPEAKLGGFEQARKFNCMFGGQMRRKLASLLLNAVG